MEGLAEVLSNPKVSREALKILGVLIRHMGWGNRTRILAREIGEELGLTPPHVSRGLKVLTEHGVVTRHLQGEYEVDPRIIFVGSLERARQRQAWRTAQEAAAKARKAAPSKI